MYTKFFLFIFFLTFQVTALFAQDFYQRAKDNLPIILNHPSLYEQIWLDSSGITLYASPDDKMAYNAEFRLEWNEAPVYLKMMNELTLKEAVEVYEAKGINSFPDSIFHLNSSDRNLPENLQGLKVALDPGHLAGNKREARMEERMMEIDASEYGLKKRIRFYEADLAYNTALIIKKQLEEAGAIVMLSREEGESARGIRFKKWYKRCFENELEHDYIHGNIDQKRYEWLKNEASRKDVFWAYFKRKDFKARARNINAFNPDITLIIHYNAHASGKLMAHDENFSMAFVGGSFVKNELKEKEHRIEFLRLLLSEDIRNSVLLSSNFMKEHEEKLGIPPVPVDNDFGYLNRSSVYAKVPGVYSRNLYMTRAVHGTLCFGESLMQENYKEAALLGKRDYREEGVKTSSRVKQVADAYVQAVRDYVIQKKSEK